jgi:mersacidin/lichenicidin family type 2 lantibiotic
MTSDQIIRAWKDESFRSSLSETELSALPEHPAGLIELSDTDINTVAGQTTPLIPIMIITPPVVTVVVSEVASSIGQGGTCHLGGLGC